MYFKGVYLGDLEMLRNAIFTVGELFHVEHIYFGSQEVGMVVRFGKL